MNASGQIPNMSEARIVQDLHGFGTARSHLADRDDLLVHIKLVDPSRQFGKRDQLSANV
jgi:hypothetical protein